MRILLSLTIVLGACSESNNSGRSGAASDPSAAPSGVREEPSEDVAASHGRKATASYDVPLRSDAELAALLDRTCEEAAERHRPWLVEVGAPWCGDCRALDALEQRSPLADELAKWPRVRVNVGDFDRHEALRDWLDVRAIAHWSVLEAAECTPALGRAPVLVQRTLEPRSGIPVSAAGLTKWLRDARHGSAGE